jgi:hypothetical protein
MVALAVNRAGGWEEDRFWMSKFSFGFYYFSLPKEKSNALFWAA